MNTKLLPKDVLIRFDEGTQSISFFTVRVGRDGPVPQLMHESDWRASAGVVELTDIGGTVAGFLLASHGDSFCTAEKWEDLAEQVRVAAGRDHED